LQPLFNILLSFHARGLVLVGKNNNKNNRPNNKVARFTYFAGIFAIGACSKNRKFYIPWCRLPKLWEGRGKLWRSRFFCDNWLIRIFV